MERKIGEIFESDGEWYQCVSSSDCPKCDLKHIECCRFKFPCESLHRNDCEEVIFKKLEKVGEPFERNGYLYQEYKAYTYPLLMNGNAKIPTDNGFAVVIKQTKEDMEEKKIQLSEEEYDYVKNEIENHILPGKLNREVYEDKVTENIMKLFSVETNYSNSEKIGKNLKPFDLQKAREGKPVCTRDGRKARIICFDRENEQPIVALIKSDKGGESAYYYYANGNDFR